LLVESSHGGFVLGLDADEVSYSSSSQPAVAVSTLPLPVELLLVSWPPVVLGSHAATLALSDKLNSTFVGGRNQLESKDSGAQVGRKFQEREWSTRLDDNGLKTVFQHVRSDKLELLRSDELDGLAEAILHCCRACRK
jgi:hypothetical protein